ncbi:MAG TPA: hypothetical protein VN773_07100 [Verrucomicrobiae bacterium]|jgi:hypothetical protein|nr:hypothetical protein [Verrucomicrobiae bacterium]
MHDLEQSGFSEFDRWRALAHRTRELLDAVIGEGALPDGGAAYLSDRTLPHVEGVQAGFVGWLRSESVGIAELRYLLARVGSIRVDGPATDAERRAAAAEAAAELDLATRTGRPTSALRVAEPWNLAALAHARLVLAMLPRIPDEDVRFPGGRRTYADIPAPRGPAELSDRLEELERSLWRTAAGRRPDPHDPAFRRAYGFFDAADRLGHQAFGSAA